MDAEDFKKLHEIIERNIGEIKNIAAKKDQYHKQDQIRVFEKTKYLFYGVTKSLIEIGNNIILENDFRQPLNNADVFVSLAEHEIIMPSIVPGVKKAVLAMPQVYGFDYDNFFTLVQESLGDLHKCLALFAVYFNLKGGGT
uniref:DUF86 domain-containing protein n=1 Tax=candidate division WOR-3 bacterium TaxID=2052148 RepID=A0A7C4TGA2_UNCW3